MSEQEDSVGSEVLICRVAGDGQHDPGLHPGSPTLVACTKCGDELPTDWPNASENPMKIQEAVDALVAGKQVARHVWRQGVRLVPKGSNPGVWQYMNGINQRWSPSIGDLSADDWYVVEPESASTDDSRRSP